MFETSQVRSYVAAQRRYGLFTVSVVVHTAVVAGVIVATVSSVSFPVRAPNEMSRWSTIIPIDLPKPPGVRHAQPAAATPHERAATLPANAAPNQIPDAVLPARPADAVNSDPHGVDGPGSGDVGDGRGVIGGVDIGQPAQPEPVPEVYHPGGEVRSAVVLHRVEPQYPRAALLSRLAGVVVLQCVIDREGNIRDAHVVRSSFAIFDEPALSALRQWKFSPGVLRGKAVDTFFELTVAFQPR